jgi:Sec-independent protein translocase protein TatA
VFGIGPTEFIIIGVVALMLFSPRELPKILRSAAKFWASLRNTADEFRDAIMNEEEMQDIRGALRGGVSDFKKAEAAARRELMKARMEMQKAQNKLLKTVKAAEESKREELAAASTLPGAATAAVGAPEGGASDDQVAATPDAGPSTAAPAESAAPAAAIAQAAHATLPEPVAPAVPGPHGTVAAARPDRPDVGQGAA